jgi:hypothetical protein
LAIFASHEVLDEWTELAGRLDSRTMVIMKHAARMIFAGLFALVLLLPGWNQAGAEEDVKNCYSVHGEARYGALAYKHVVIVTNRCEMNLQCEVWTDVDPSPRQSVSVGPKGTGEVIVRATSPSRSFKAFGECKGQ